MKYYLLLVSIFFANLSVFGQHKNGYKFGEIEGLRYTADGKIHVLTSSGYYTNKNFKKNTWRFKKINKEGTFGQSQSHFLFLNPEVGIQTVLKSTSTSKQDVSCYYHTNNGGKNWSILNYYTNEKTREDEFILAAHTAEQKVWLVSENSLLYSADLAMTWEKIPIKNANRYFPEYIHMQNDSVGIIGMNCNYISITNDNWKTSVSIPSPHTQKKYVEETCTTTDAILKAIFWKDYIIVNQENRFFYTKKDKIDWQPFHKDVIDFELDITNRHLYVITTDFEIWQMNTIDQFEYFGKAPRAEKPIDWLINHDTVYTCFEHHRIYRTHSRGMDSSATFAFHPNYRKKYNFWESTYKKKGVSTSNLTWNYNQSSIYIQEKGSKDWNAVGLAPFHIAGLNTLGDSSIVLWDRISNHRYDLRKSEFSPYKYDKPIEDFLAHPIDSIAITVVHAGCFYEDKKNITYRKNDANEMIASEIRISENYKRRQKDFNRTIAYHKLTRLLQKIDTTTLPPNIKNFEISAQDEIDFKKWVDATVAYQDSVEPQISFRTSPLLVNKEFYYTAVEHVDTIGKKTLLSILNKQPTFFSTENTSLSLTIYNDNGEDIHIERPDFLEYSAWGFPWTIKYADKYFLSYDLELSKFLLGLVPQEDFGGVGDFDNQHLLQQIVHYLHGQQQE